MWAEHSGKNFDESTLWGDCFVIFVVSIYSAHWNCICLLYLYYWKSIQLNVLNFPCNTENFCASKSIPLVLSFTVWLYDFGFQQYATRSGGNHSWCKREAKFSQLQCKSSCWISHQHRHNQNSGTGTLIIWRAAWVLIVVVGITCIHVFIYYDKQVSLQREQILGVRLLYGGMIRQLNLVTEGWTARKILCMCITLIQLRLSKYIHIDGWYGILWVTM